MKRLFTIIFIVTLALTVAGIALAENNADDQVRACLTANKLLQPEQLQIWDNTAACFATQNGARALCVLQKQENYWELSICNPNALLQEENLPTLVLDSDNALFWTYLYPDKVVRFHAARNTDGTWGPVDETSSFSRGEVWYTYNVSFSSENGGEICRRAIVEDENGNDMSHEHTDYLPAPWLKEYVQLSSFELSMFPTMGFSGDYSDSWPGQTFLAEAAAEFMPEYVFVNGILQSSELHFLMQKPDDSRVYVICSYINNTPRTVGIQESSTLPDGTFLGVDNFSDSLGIERNGSLQAITVQTFPRGGGRGIHTVWNFDDESPLIFGRSCFYLGNERDVIWCGNHQWSLIYAIDWSAIPTSVDEAKRGFRSEEYAVVNNPNPQDRLHLREKPDKGSKSLGKYYNGTPVHVSEIRGDWACVYVGNQDGWMMKKYLTFGRIDQPLMCDTSAMPQLMARSEYELCVYPWPEVYDSDALYVNAFSDSSYQNMKIIGIIGNEWYHVWFPENDEYGFVKQSDLWPGNG